MRSPFCEGGFNVFPQQALQNEFNDAQSHDSWKIDLPGGGFIEAPGSELGSNTSNNHFPTGATPEYSDELVLVAAEIHEEPNSSRPPLQSVVRMIKHCKNILGEQLARNGEHQQLAEQIEVLEDNGALNEKVKKRGFFFFAKKLFKVKHKSGFRHTKTSKKVFKAHWSGVE